MTIAKIQIIKIKKSYQWKALDIDNKVKFHSLFMGYERVIDEATDIAIQLKDDDHSVSILKGDDGKIAWLVLID